MHAMWIGVVVSVGIFLGPKPNERLGSPNLSRTLVFGCPEGQMEDGARRAASRGGPRDGAEPAPVVEPPNHPCRSRRRGGSSAWPRRRCSHVRPERCSSTCSGRGRTSPASRAGRAGVRSRGDRTRNDGRAHVVAAPRSMDRRGARSARMVLAVGEHEATTCPGGASRLSWAARRPISRATWLSGPRTRRR